MENKGEKIDRYFKERLEQFEQKPDEIVWKNIASTLGHNKRKGLTYIILRIAAGMIILASLGIGYYWIMRTENKTNQPIQSMNTGKAVVKDSTSNERIRKTSIQKAKTNKTKRSDRLEPVRKIYKGPPVITSQNIPDNYDLEILNKQKNNNSTLKVRNQDFSNELLTAIDRIPVTSLPLDLPRQLNHSHLVNTRNQIDNQSIDLYYSSSENASEEGQTKPSRWILGSEFAPMYSYRTVASEYLNVSTMDELNKNESGIVTYAGGIKVAFATGRRFSVQSGVYYSRYGQEKNNVEEYSYYFLENRTDVSTGRYLSISNSTGTITCNNADFSGNYKAKQNAAGSNADIESYFNFISNVNTNLTPVVGNNITLTQYFDYLELPVMLKYDVIDRKLDFSLIAGVITNFLVNNVINIKQNGNSESFGKTTDIKQVNYLGSIGLGLEYPITKKFALNLEPRFRYYINPINKSSELNVHPYSFGFFAGLSYLF
jgi:hypothetical protein